MKYYLQIFLVMHPARKIEIWIFLVGQMVLQLSLKGTKCSWEGMKIINLFVCLCDLYISASKTQRISHMEQNWVVKSSPQCRHPDHDFVPHSPVSVFSSWWELFFAFCLSWSTYSCMEFPVTENQIGCCMEHMEHTRCFLTGTPSKSSKYKKVNLG